MVVSYNAATFLHTHITINRFTCHGTGTIAVDDPAAIVSDDTATCVNIVHILECCLVITISNRAIASIISDNASKAIITINTSGIVAIVNLCLGRSLACNTADIV